MTIVSSFCYAEGCSIYSTYEYQNDNVEVDNEIESAIIYKDEFTIHGIENEGEDDYKSIYLKHLKFELAAYHNQAHQ